ncbi:MAG: DUF4355 domain-containing protein [Clostridium chrysemydis]|uniref:DUF4355 domain-containing protein n=1 Tax=Clostridium TaxID=1485 RepID=UPI00215250C1|nr:DUF4355 domain-containing protein [Clostridium sp. LY3-2]MCR6516320.1 DUF4355 domain-containing protein [Clostridium sp. LY3-2]
MKKSELLQLIENIEDEGSVDEVLSKSDLAKLLTKNSLTLDAFKEKMKDKDFKAFIDSLNDKHFEKALKTWKDNNLEKELEPFIQEKYPELVTDPVQKEIAALKKQLEDEKKANSKKDLLTEAIKYATEKKIPTTLVERFLDEDIEKTKANLDTFVESINPWVDEKVNERVGAGSWVPGDSGEGSKLSIGEEMAQAKNGTTVEGPNPWA